ncbi:hypothetical protein [Paenibacillus sp. L3-i20]|uniref:hypothetical protein n=1 Tax=Paenibacillus sp. L3-i20 TaxID=2905833 RepID=UPI002085BBFD|nr:hypothetical protein [Paenibacillus sp. L3-i20]GKU76251.1 hypothetical protein L3i20_v206480 [Paenibacillus sp. L3-i20]
MTNEERKVPSLEEVLLLIERLLPFAHQRELLHESDMTSTRNSLLDLFKLAEPHREELNHEELDSAVPLLEQLLDYGYVIGLIPSQTVLQRDLLDSRIMGLLLPR